MTGTLAIRRLVSRGWVPSLVIVVAGGLLAVFQPVSPAQGSEAPVPESLARSMPRGLLDPRGVYLDPGGQETTDTPVGRLTLQHLVDGVPREVSRHHRFRSGDRFRFQVSANRQGWLYVLHHTGDGPVSPLWPSGAFDDADPDVNRLRPRVVKLVPPPPAVFVFDQTVGVEHFYVTVVSEPQPPSLSVVAQDSVSVSETPAVQSMASPELPPPPGPRIIQFSVRSHTGSTPSPPSRGVVLDPDPQGTDPATYFSLLAQDAGGTLIFEFQLHHED